MSSITEAITAAEKLVKPATTPSTPLPVTDVSKTTAATPAATTATSSSGSTISGITSLLNAPEGSTAINPATGKEMALSYTDMKDVPEGTFVVGFSRPAKTLTEAYARVAAAERGEPDPYLVYKVAALPQIGRAHV